MPVAQISKIKCHPERILNSIAKSLENSKEPMCLLVSQVLILSNSKEVHQGLRQIFEELHQGFDWGGLMFHKDTDILLEEIKINAMENETIVAAPK